MAGRRASERRRGTTEEEDSDGGSREASRRMELSAEAQMKIIEHTGILDRRIPLRRFGEPDQQRPAPKPPTPLVQFSTLELDRFANSLKTPTSNHHPLDQPDHLLVHDDDDDDDQDTVRNLSRDRASSNSQVDSLPLWVDRAFDSFLWSIPFITVFVCL
jgi:hypothetical protein